MAPTHSMAADDPQVVAFVASVRAGDVPAVRAALATQPALASARLGDAQMSRESLHVVTDWPGHVPHVAELIEVLVAAGADVNARFAGPHQETPLHWAASADDVESIDALVAAGADLEASGGVLTGGPPLDDAVVFANWDAARRLVHHGATTALFHAAALGMVERVVTLLADDTEGAAPAGVDNALWHACHAGEVGTSRLLLEAGADPRWAGWDDTTPLDVARGTGDGELVALLESATAGP